MYAFNTHTHHFWHQSWSAHEHYMESRQQLNSTCQWLRLETRNNVRFASALTAAASFIAPMHVLLYNAWHAVHFNERSGCRPMCLKGGSWKARCKIAVCVSGAHAHEA